ncbi:reverse transcriptase domain-containing protein [Tanacetum coccineum]
MPPKKTTTPMTDEAIRALIAQGIANALAEHEANRSRNGGDNHESGSDERSQVPTARECTYGDFLKCQPLNFKGTEGVVGLTQWFERMESVFHISNCTVGNQVKYATCTLLVNALTWWNSHVKTELALMCERMFPEESDQKVRTFAESEKKEYAGTLPLYNKCKFHHNGPCTVKCANCNKVGHLTRDCRSLAATNNQRTLTCYECGNQGHYRSDCPELKNQNNENQAGGTEARGMVKKEKLAPRFVGPFEITERISPVAYRLDLPEELDGVHDTFHVSNLKKCLVDPTLPLDEIQVDAKLNFMEEPVEILERGFKKLSGVELPSSRFGGIRNVDLNSRGNVKTR